MKEKFYLGHLNGNPIIVCKDHLAKLGTEAYATFDPNPKVKFVGTGLFCHYCRKERVTAHAKPSVPVPITRPVVKKVA